MENIYLRNIWCQIRNELAVLQDQSPKESLGQVINPIMGIVYPQNTSCAALVFATEYLRTHDSSWLTRAMMALDSLRRVDISSGVDNPRWKRLGWRANKGCLFTTGTLLDAYWRTLSVLELEDKETDFPRLLNFIGSCKIKPGLYAHDSIKQKTKILHPVQNISAIVMFLLGTIGKLCKDNAAEISQESKTIQYYLIEGQRDDGFWPYMYPGEIQKIMYKHRYVQFITSRLPYIRSLLIKKGDDSIFFGDAVHHCLVFYYLCKSALLFPTDLSYIKKLISGWTWIQKHLIESSDGGLKFDFSWEPHPRTFRYANFRDTSTYFLIVASLPHLLELDIIKKDDYFYVSNGLFKHISNDLLTPNPFNTVIVPYEGPEEVVDLILPRVGEATAWKGALLAEYYLTKEASK